MRIIDLRTENISIVIDELNKRNQLEVKDVNDTVNEIILNVKYNKDKALFEYTKKFDKVELGSNNIKVTKEEIKQAYELVEEKFVAVIKRACKRIEDFHKNQIEKSWFITGNDGEILGQMVRPIENIGIYTPGGTAAYPSSVLMNTIPAKVAGVSNIIMVTPPTKDGSISPEVLVAANEAGVDEIYKCGGAQAVAALAFGTESVPKVDKIVGPGNIYVATAKRFVFGYCDIDMIAGPSEITVIADDHANAELVAADLLSQAEHDVLAASILVTDSEALAQLVSEEVIKQLKDLPRNQIASKSLQDYGLVVIVKDLDEACNISNIIAPEHLEIYTQRPFELLPMIKNAGAIFLGSYSSEPIGDYMAGPNHVLPTSGTSRFFSPLGVYDFVKRSSIISMTKKAVKNIGEDVVYFANKEGLFAHGSAVSKRMDNQ